MQKLFVIYSHLGMILINCQEIGLLNLSNSLFLGQKIQLWPIFTKLSILISFTEVSILISSTEMILLNHVGFVE